MNYLKIYKNLCEKGNTKRSFIPSWGRFESHHINPKHNGGDNSFTNKTVLHHKEHILAHHLLYRLYNRLEDKLAWKMMKGVLKDPWQDPDYAKLLKEKVIHNLSKVDRNKQKAATSLVGRRAVKNKTGIHADGMSIIAVKASKEWAKHNPQLAQQRSRDSHKNRTPQDYIRMANTKARYNPIAPDGTKFNSVAEAAYTTGTSRSNIDNWTRRNQYGWSRVQTTGKA